MEQWLVIDGYWNIVSRCDTEQSAQAKAEIFTKEGPVFIYQMHTAVCAKVEFEKLTPAMWAAREGGGK